MKNSIHTSSLPYEQSDSPELSSHAINISIARGLLSYGMQSSSFRNSARKILLSTRDFQSRLRKTSSGDHAKFTVIHPSLQPVNDTHACERLYSLLHAMNFDRNKEEIVNLLMPLAHDAPQREESLVIGIVGLAIPGITLGNIKITRKKKNILSIFVLENTKSKNASVLSRFVGEATAYFIQNTIRLTGGISDLLDPLVHDWLFTDQQTKVRILTNEPFTATHRELTTSKLPHILFHRLGLSALIVHPIVHLDIQSLE